MIDPKIIEQLANSFNNQEENFYQNNQEKFAQAVHRLIEQGYFKNQLDSVFVTGDGQILAAQLTIDEKQQLTPSSFNYPLAEQSPVALQKQLEHLFLH